VTSETLEAAAPASSRRHLFAPYLLSAPALLLFVGIVLVPLVMTLLLSFYQWSLTGGIRENFSLGNWRDIAGDSYFHEITRCSCAPSASRPW
jgi:putative spermidine/putrescine transport system permease protein